MTPSAWTQGEVNARTQWMKSQNMQYNAKDFNKVQKRTHTSKHLHYSPHWQMNLIQRSCKVLIVFTLNKSEVICRPYMDQKTQSLPTYEHLFTPFPKKSGKSNHYTVLGCYVYSILWLLRRSEYIWYHTYKNIPPPLLIACRTERQQTKLKALKETKSVDPGHIRRGPNSVNTSGPHNHLLYIVFSQGRRNSLWSRPSVHLRGNKQTKSILRALILWCSYCRCFIWLYLRSLELTI